MTHFNLIKKIFLFLCLLFCQKTYSSTTTSTITAKKILFSKTVYLLMDPHNPLYKTIFSKPLTHFFTILLEDLPPNKKIYPLLDFYASELMTKDFKKTNAALDTESLLIGLLLITGKIVHPEFNSSNLLDHINAFKNPRYRFPTRIWTREDIEKSEEEILTGLGPKIFINKRTTETKKLRELLNEIAINQRIRERITDKYLNKKIKKTNKESFRLVRISLFFIQEEERARVQPFLTLFIHTLFKEINRLQFDPSCLNLTSIYLLRLIESSTQKMNMPYSELQYLIYTAAYLSKAYHEDESTELIDFCYELKKTLKKLISDDRYELHAVLKKQIPVFCGFISYSLFVDSDEFYAFDKAEYW